MIPHLRTQTISFRTPHERITRNVINEINRAKIGHEAEGYLKHRWHYDDTKMRQVLWKELGSVINGVLFYRKMQYSRILHKQWPTMKRNFLWKYSETDKCPMCTTQVETREHVLLCTDELAITYRDKMLLGLKTDLLKNHTDPFLTNHIMRILRQFHSGYPVTKIPILPDIGGIQLHRIQLLNTVIDNGVDNLLSGVITREISEFQQFHITDQSLESVINIVRWNRMFIRLILDYTNSLWLYRCTILHSTKNLQRDTILRKQAIDLLRKLKYDPFQLPYNSRDLMHRSSSKMMTADLSSVRNWIARVSVALDIQSKNVKLGLSDIRNWLDMKSTLTSHRDDGFFIPGCDVDYDSDTTIEFFDKYPDERIDAKTWDCDRIVCSRSNLHDRFPCLTCFNQTLPFYPRST